MIEDSAGVETTFTPVNFVDPLAVLDIPDTDPLERREVPETDIGFLTGMLTSIETAHFGLFDGPDAWTALSYDSSATIFVDPDVALESAAAHTPLPHP